MKKILVLFIVLAMIAGTSGSAQSKGQVNNPPKVLVFYFHPSERCPIDQSIEANTKTVIRTYFAGETRNGTISFKVFNTEDKANASVIAKFDINAQALYIVKLDKGKEIQKDLTRFAFDYGLSNPGKFKSGLKEEITKALK
jgi:hypothetical protein